MVLDIYMDQISRKMRLETKNEWYLIFCLTNSMNKRLSYIKRLESDLAIAIEHGRVDIVLSLTSAIEKYKLYKHNWYIKNKDKKSIIKGEA